MDNLKLARKLVVLTLLITAVAVNLGAFTRLVDAGLGCPDWPGCYGHVMWPDTAEEVAIANEQFAEAPVEADKMWPEMVHRYFASTVGLFIIALLALCWKTGPRKLCIGLLGLVLLQGAFGAWTVTLKLWPQVVTAHLLGGFATLSLIWLLLQRLYQFEWPSHVRMIALRPLLVIGTFVVIAQIALGGWTSSNYAALACTDLLTCHGQWIPDADYRAGFDVTQQIGPNYLGGQLENDARIAIHYVHRLGALIATFVTLMLAARLWRAGGRQPKRMALILVSALGIQVLLGISNIIFALPLAIAVAHNAGGAVLLLCYVTLLHRVFNMQASVALTKEAKA